MRGHVLIDNFAVQGAHNYLWGEDRGKIPSECLATVIDAVVLYDKVCVPDLGRESHYGVVGNGLFYEYEDAAKWRKVLETFSDVVPVEFVSPDIPRLYREGFLNQGYQLTIDGASAIYDLETSPFAADFPFPSYDPCELSTRIEAEDGFRPFEEYRENIWELARIDPLLVRLFPFRTMGLKGRTEDELFRLFVGTHLYYTDYCVELARTQQLNYLPNSTRVRLIDSSSAFQQSILLENVRRDIIDRFQHIRMHHIEKLTQMLNIRTVSIDAPLLFNYVTRSSSQPDDVVNCVKEVRNSKEAKAFRRVLPRGRGGYRKPPAEDSLAESGRDKEGSRQVGGKFRDAAGEKDNQRQGVRHRCVWARHS